MLRYGIVGTGMMGSEHIMSLRNIDGVEITAATEIVSKSTTIPVTTSIPVSTTTVNTPTTVTTLAPNIPPPPTSSQQGVGCVGIQTLDAWFPDSNFSPLSILGYPQTTPGPPFEESNFTWGCFQNKYFTGVVAGEYWSQGVGMGISTQGVLIIMDWWTPPFRYTQFIPVPNPPNVRTPPLKIVSINPNGDILTLQPISGPAATYYFSIPLGKFIS